MAEISDNAKEIEHYNGLLTSRYPDAADLNTRIGFLTAMFGAKAVISVLDAVDGFQTPPPSNDELS